MTTKNSFLALVLSLTSATAFAGHWNSCHTSAGGPHRANSRAREHAQPELNLAKIDVFFESIGGEKENTTVLELIQSDDPEKLAFAQDVLIEYLSSIPASYWSDKYVHHIFSNGPEIFFTPFVEKFVHKYAGHRNQAKIIENFSRQISRLQGTSPHRIGGCEL